MIALALTVDGVAFNVSPSPGDLVKLERKYEISAGELDDSARVEWIMFLAYSCLKRTDRTTLSFDEFLDVVEMEEKEESSPPPQPSS